MRGDRKVFTLASVALLSCRAVLGIEDIEPTTDAGASDSGTADVMDGGADTALNDSAVDTGIDTGADAGLCSGKTGNECGKCCRDSNQVANKDLETKLSPCLCDGGCGADECTTTNICGGAAEPKDTPCIPCMDTTIKTGSCPKGRDECLKSPTCKAVYECLAACK